MLLKTQRNFNDQHGCRHSTVSAARADLGRWEIAALSHDEIAQMRRDELVEIVSSCLPAEVAVAVLDEPDRQDDQLLRRWVRTARSTCRKQGY